MIRSILLALAVLLAGLSLAGVAWLWYQHDAQALALLHVQRKLADQAHEIQWLKEDLASVQKECQGAATLAAACTSTTYQLRLRLRRLEQAYPVEGR